jgi:hypothetical protein
MPKLVLTTEAQAASLFRQRSTSRDSMHLAVRGIAAIPALAFLDSMIAMHFTDAP